MWTVAPLQLAVLLLGDTTSALSLSPKARTQEQLASRRKSPALWREDLVPSDNRTIQKVVPARSEIMAPAGGWPQLRAAVGNGADAVYLGLSAYSARARATNFHVDNELPQAVDFCHSAGVKVYVALNTLVFDTELEEVSELIQRANWAGIDALIVQDLGVAKLAKRVAPDMAIHSSTQQTVTSSDGVAFCRDQHEATRVVLGRELSVDEMKQVASESDVEIEAFVHGALCVSYSGQCFSSEAWGGRSANRGQCAQACRMPYGLIVNGELRELQDMKYLLSPQDLCGLENVPELMKAGVSCLKIEGRLKDEAYVAATTRAYRRAVDEAWEKLTGEIPVRDFSSETVSKAELSQLFSRGQDEDHPGLTPGFLQGTQHQMVVRGRSPRHRGVHVGYVCEGSSPRTGLIVQQSGDELKLGDGIVIDRGLAEEEELGGPIFELESLSGGRVLVKFSRDAMKRWKKADEISKKGRGARSPLAPSSSHVWKTADAIVEKKMRRLSNVLPPRPKVKVKISGKVNEPLTVRLSLADTFVEAHSSEPLCVVKGSGMSAKQVSKAIGTLGNTRWEIDGAVDLSELSSDAWCPMSKVKQARRIAVERLEELHDNKSRKGDKLQSKLLSGAPEKMVIERKPEGIEHPVDRPKVQLGVLVRSIEQVEAVCEIIESGGSVDEVIIDFLEVDGMREAADRVRQTSANVVLASPRILKPGESGIWRTLLRLRPDGLLVRSPGLLQKMTSLGGTGAAVVLDPEAQDNFTIPQLHGDFSLNVANALTALELLESGLNRVTPTYDLNANAIADLARYLGPRARQVEVIVHAKVPIFHTEHCVFARFLSNGNSYVDCGHACTRHQVHLRDQTGADNVVLADMGCRNTVFASRAQSGIHSLQQWKATGIGRVRVELVDEGCDDAKKVVQGYINVLEGTAKPNVVWQDLARIRDSNGREGGISLGSFNNKVERRAGEI